MNSAAPDPLDTISPDSGKKRLESGPWPVRDAWPAHA
jgi:hypothetical protein